MHYKSVVRSVIPFGLFIYVAWLLCNVASQAENMGALTASATEDAQILNSVHD